MAVSARVQLFARDFGEGKRKSGKKLASLFVLFFLFHFSGEQYQTCQIRVGFCISAGERSCNLNERVVHLGFLIYSGCYHLNQRLNYAKYSNDSPNKRRLITHVPDPTSEMYVALLQISPNWTGQRLSVDWPFRSAAPPVSGRSVKAEELTHFPCGIQSFIVLLHTWR